MFRSVALIAAAIHLANPAISKSTARAHAASLQRSAETHDYDPYTGVAIGQHETRWRPTAIGGAAGKCYGLFQVCVQWAVPACRDDFASARCVSERNALLVAPHAISRLGVDIRRWRAYCRKATGKPALFHRWLAAYQGYDARNRTTCGQVKTKKGWSDAPIQRATRDVMRFRRRLLREIGS